MGRVVFFAQEAVRALRRSAAPSIAAIVTITATTLLLGVLVPVLKASSDTAADVRDQIALRVFLHDDATRADRNQLQRQIQGLEHVRDVEYISKGQAVEVLETNLRGDLRESIGELGRNPLPASFNVSLDSPDHLEAVRAAIVPSGPDGRPAPISAAIEDVADKREDATAIRQVTGAVTIVLIGVGILLVAASLALVANTIRLSIYARRREVEVMRLVGATNWFIRWPFIVEGLIVGLAGAVVAVAILWLGKVTIVDPLADSFALVENFSTVGFLPLIGILVAAAMLVSALGSGLTLRRFLQA